MIQPTCRKVVQVVNIGTDNSASGIVFKVKYVIMQFHCNLYALHCINPTKFVCKNTCDYDVNIVKEIILVKNICHGHIDRTV